LGNDFILSLYEDESSDLWVGTATGLDRMNINKGEFTHYKAFPEDTVIGGKNLTPSIIEDSKHNLWTGNYNEGGVHILNRNTGQFKNYLNRRSVLCLHEDGFGKI